LTYEKVIAILRRALNQESINQRWNEWYADWQSDSSYQLCNRTAGRSPSCVRSIIHRAQIRDSAGNPV